MKELTPTVAAMVRLQWLTGMRPGEVVHLRPCDIDRSGDIWEYRPPVHKNQHKKSRRAKTRIVTIGPQAQVILRPYLLRDYRAFCFTPEESYQQHLEHRHAQRQTPMHQGNIPGSRKLRSFHPRFTRDAYRRAIQRAALRAYKPPKEVKTDPLKLKERHRLYKWSPNQLRHNAGTLAREKMGLETAQQIHGHTESRTTENHYAEIDLNLAVEFARKYG